MPEQLLHDLRDAVRALRKRPGFALVVILTLALGIGANTAIFSVVNRVLLQPLQFRDANRLYVMHEIVPQWAKAFPVMDANYEGFQIWKQQVHSFSEIAIAENTAMTLTGAGDPVQVRGTRGSANLLQLLGVRPVLGRPFSAAEDEAGHGQVVILTDAFWRGGFHADAGTVGRSIMLDGVAYTVVGVLPRSFHFPGMVNGFSQTSQYVIPLGGERWYEQGLIGDFDFTAIGRLREGVTLEQALAELNVVQARIAKLADSKLDLRAQLSPLQTEVVGSARNGLMLLMAAVGAVLLMICVNLANLLLARVPGRMREAGIRKALGATGARLTQHALVEYLLLGLLGGTGGVVLALFSARWMAQLAPLHLPRMAEIGVDGPALIFALTVSVLTAVLFGMLPALLLARTDLGATLAAGGKSVTESRRSRRLRSGLVGVQIALCTVLLIVAGLLGGSVLRLLNVDPGFDVDHVLAAEVYLPSGGYDRLPVRDAFYQRALDSIRSLPGVQSAAWVHILPLGGQGSGNSINLLGEQQLPSNEQPHANYRAISPDYFRTMQIPLIAGRTFDEHDRGKQRIIISNTLAKKLWPGKSPVGQQCRAMWGMLQRQPSEVIGVVGDIRNRLDRPAENWVYVPDAQTFAGGQPIMGAPLAAAFVVRTQLSPNALVPAVNTAIHGAGADVPILALRPMSSLVAQGVETRRFQMLLTATFAVSALLLASLGIFGVVAYSVEQRRREFGIRSALGAHGADLLKLVMRQGFAPVAGGVLAGIGGALACGTLLQSFVFGMSARDPLTFAIVCAVVALVGAIACFIPARRSMSIDPMVALRYE